jgi:hypothetical protein
MAQDALGRVLPYASQAVYYKRQIVILDRLGDLIREAEGQFSLMLSDEAYLARLIQMKRLPMAPSPGDPPHVVAFLASKRVMGNLFVRAHLGWAARGWRGLREKKPPEEKRERPKFLLDFYEEERERGLGAMAAWLAEFWYYEGYWEQDMENALRIASLAGPIPIAETVLEEMDTNRDRVISKTELVDFIKREIVGGSAAAPGARGTR